MKSKTQVLLAISILAGAGFLLFAPDRQANSFAANAQPTEYGHDSVSVIPIQTARDGYGLAMIDQKNETLLVYEINSRAPAYSKLRLVAARSFKYDRLLDEFNTGDPKPDDVRNVVRQMLRSDIKPLDQSKALSEPNDEQDPNNINPVE